MHMDNYYIFNNFSFEDGIQLFVGWMVRYTWGR